MQLFLFVSLPEFSFLIPQGVEGMYVWYVCMKYLIKATRVDN